MRKGAILLSACMVDSAESAMRPARELRPEGPAIRLPLSQSHGVDEFKDSQLSQLALAAGVTGLACAQAHVGSAICYAHVPHTCRRKHDGVGV